MPFTVDVSAESSSPADLIFRHLAVAESWNVWGRLPWPLRAVRARAGDEIPDGVGAIRRIGLVREQVTEYEPPQLYGYVMVAGVPVRDYSGNVSMESAEGGTTIRWQASFEPKIPGTGPLFRLFATGLLGTLTKRLAAHAEHCESGCPAH